MQDFPHAELLWLEAKQVLRGFKSEIFPGLDKHLAQRIRTMGFENLKKAIEEQKNG